MDANDLIKTFAWPLQGGSGPHMGARNAHANRRRDLLEIVEDRYDRGSILITSPIPVDRWYEIIGSTTLADAILDRVVHNAYRIDHR